MAMISHSDRKPLTNGDRISASVDERAEAFATSFAYAGRYSLAGDKIIHHIEIASVQNWVRQNYPNDTTNFRRGKNPDNRISLGATQVVWRRLVGWDIGSQHWHTVHILAVLGRSLMR
jgi:hypothetical protein